MTNRIHGIKCRRDLRIDRDNGCTDNRTGTFDGSDSIGDGLDLIGRIDQCLADVWTASVTCARNE